MEGIDSKEALENQLKENIKAEKDADAENKYIDALLDEAAKDVEVDVPQPMIDEEINRIVATTKNI